MASRRHRALLLCLAALLFAPLSFASAYDGRPRLIVIVILDQVRGDFLERSRARFGAGGFNLFLEHGAVFTGCHYDYANTHTAPGHATLLTGAYPDGHGIAGNQWWDPEKQKVVTSVEDERTPLLGEPGGTKTGASPRRLLASTLGDVLKLATGGKSRVFGISLKDRGAILPAGWAVLRYVPGYESALPALSGELRARDYRLPLPWLYLAVGAVVALSAILPWGLAGGGSDSGIEMRAGVVVLAAGLAAVALSLVALTRLVPWELLRIGQFAAGAVAGYAAFFQVADILEASEDFGLGDLGAGLFVAALASVLLVALSLLDRPQEAPEAAA